VSKLTQMDHYHRATLGISTGANTADILDTSNRAKSIRDQGCPIRRLSPAGLAFFAANGGSNRLTDLRRNATADVRALLGVEPEPAKSVRDITHEIMTCRGQSNGHRQTARSGALFLLRSSFSKTKSCFTF